MARGSVKLSIWSSYDPTGTTAAEKAIERFTRKYGTLTTTEAGSAYALDATTSALVNQSVAADRLAARLSTAATAMGTAGSAATRGITVPVAAAAYACVKSASDMETAFASVKKTVDATDSQYQALYDDAVSFSEVHPISAADVATIESLGAQLGISTDNLSSFAQVVYGLDIATDLDADTAATELAQFANITCTSEAELSNIGSTVVELGNTSATTESTIMDMGLRLAAAGTQAGMSSSDILGISAALSSLGMDAESGGTAISTVINQIGSDVATNSDNLQIWADTAGMSVDEFSAAWSAGGDSTTAALEAITTGMASTSDEGGNLTVLLDSLGITGIRQSDAMKRLASNTDLLTSSVSNANAAYGANSALTTEVANFEDTFASKLEVVKNKATAVAMEFGGPLMDALSGGLDAITPWIERLGEMAEAFAGMDEGQQRVVIRTIALVAAAGPALTMASKVIGVASKGAATWGKVTAALARHTAARAASTSADVAGVAATRAGSAAVAADAAVQRTGTLALKTRTTATTAATAATEASTVATRAARIASGGLATILAGAALTAVVKIAGAVRDAKQKQDEYNSAMRGVSDVMRDAASASDGYGAATEANDERVRKSADDAVSATQDIIDKRQEYLDTASETASTLATNSGMLDYYLDTITRLQDKTGLTAGEQAQLAAAVAGVNDICGTSISVLDGQNGKLSMQRDTIYQVVDAYQDYAEAQAYQELYIEAVKGRASAERDATRASEDASEVISQLPQQYQDVATKISEGQQLSEDDLIVQGRMSQAYRTQVDQLKSYGDETRIANDAVNRYSEDMSYYQTQLNSTADAINTTVAAEKEYIDGNGAMTDALASIGEGSDMFAQSLSNLGLSTVDIAEVSDDTWASIIETYGTSEDAIVAGLAANGIDVAELASRNGENTADAFANGLSDGARAAMQAANSVSGQTVAEFQASVASYGITGDDAITAYANAIASGESADVAAQQALDVQLGLSSADTASAGSQAIRAWYTGMTSEQQNAVTAAASVAGISVAQLYNSYTLSGSAGSMTIDDYAAGIASGTITATAAATGVSTSATSSLSSSDGGAGAGLGRSYAIGISGQSGASGAGGTANADAARDGIQRWNGSYYGWGSDAGGSFSSGLRSSADSAGSAASEIADRVRSILHFSAPDEGPMADFATWVPDMSDLYVGGLETMADEAHLAALDVAMGVSSGLGEVSAVNMAMDVTAGPGAAGVSAGAVVNNSYSTSYTIAGIDVSGDADATQAIRVIVDRALAVKGMM